MTDIEIIGLAHENPSPPRIVDLRDDPSPPRVVYTADRLRLESQRIGDMVERYGLRIAAGPVDRPHSTPINRNREDRDIATALVRHTRALAGMIRAGMDAESDWPAL